MTTQEALFEYTLRLGDNGLVLGHRLSEWCGHGPVLEEDIAITNVALDLLGQARFFLTYAGEIEDKGRTEDDLAYLRQEAEYRNALLVEQPNGHFGDTIARQFYYDAFTYFLYSEMVNSTDEKLAAIAAKSLKESTYHLRHSADWIIRLGDGTAESHEKIVTSIHELWAFTGELFAADEVDNTLVATGIAVDLDKIKPLWLDKVKAVLTEATIPHPDMDEWMQRGGKQGRHTEHLGFILAEMQHLPRTYPGASW